MTDSTTPKQLNAPDSPVQRPSWRFSGRRGTPVHLRDQAPAARAARPNMSFTEAPSAAVQHASSAQQSPPVAAAPVPVERRARTERQPDTVTPSPIIPPATTSAEASKPLEAPAELHAQTVEPQGTKPTPSSAPTPSRKRTARAKAKAKAKARAKAQSKPRLLARDRTASPTEPVAIEPAPLKPAAVEPVAVEPVAVEPTVADLPAAIFAPLTTSPIDDAPKSTVDYPTPSTGIEAGRQAAWELGRLPILLEPQIEPPVEQSIEPIIELPREPEASSSTPEPTTLQPINWRHVGRNPAPAPIPLESDDARPTPPSIEQLSQPLLSSGARAGARASNMSTDDRAPAVRAAQARHQVSRRRRDLDALVDKLAGIGAPPNRP